MSKFSITHETQRRINVFEDQTVHGLMKKQARVVLEISTEFLASSLAFMNALCMRRYTYIRVR